MIDSMECYYVRCDECPEDDGEFGPHADWERDAAKEALSEGWLVENGDDICPNCQQQRKIDACGNDGGHALVLTGRFKDGPECYDCQTCPYWEVTDQPTLTGAGDLGG